MNVELKKLKIRIYFIGGVILLALACMIWFVTRSFSTLSVLPKGATVYIDGVKIKIANGIANVNVTMGEHLVKAEADGYIGFSQDLKFPRGMSNTVTVNLSAVPKPLEITNNGQFLVKGNDFNNGFYLSDKTIYKTKVGLTESGNVSILENRPVTDARLQDVREIIWSPSKDLALLRKSNSVTLFDFMKYDFVHQTETAWGGSDIGSIAWAPDNSKIAYSYAPNTGEKSLVFTNILNTDIERVVNFVALDVDNPILRWSPDSEWLLIIPRNKDVAQNNIYLFNTYSRVIKKITDTGSVLDANFSPDSNKILYSTFSSLPDSPIQSLLSIMNKDGSGQKSLGLRAELDKTAWSKDSRNIVVATLDPETKRESIFKFDTISAEEAGFSIKNLGESFVDALALSDDEKIVLYEVSGVLYAIKVE